MVFFSRKTIHLKYFLTALVFLAGIFFVLPVDAATISLRASAGSVNVGGTFTVKALINTQSESINNVESAINFPNDLVEVTSVSTQGSILSLWVEQPSFLNSSGVVSFNGGVPNPGYNGSGGTIVTINFKAKSPGSATIYFSGAAVRANDGLGTDLLSGQGSASVTVNGTAVAEPKPPTAPEVEKMTNPVIYSSTYPDQNSWYSAKSGSVSFKYPAGASTVQTLIGNNPSNTPNVSYTPPITSKTIGNLTDGVWYFSFRYKLDGQWSNVTRYKIQIDTVVPKNLSAETVTTTAGLVALNLKADDSHLDHFEINIDGNPGLIVSLEQASQPVVLPNLTGGTHQVKIGAYDKAGNKVEITKEVMAEFAPSPVVVAPVVATLTPVVAPIIPASIAWPNISIPWQNVLPVIGWLLLIFFLLYGWYKFLIARRKLLVAKKRADQAYMMLLDQADGQIEILGKSSQKRRLVKSEAVALSDLKQIIKKIRELKENED